MMFTNHIFISRNLKLIVELTYISIYAQDKINGIKSLKLIFTYCNPTVAAVNNNLGFCIGKRCRTKYV